MSDKIDRSLYRRCFGCGEENPIGAHLKFEKISEDTVISYFSPPSTWVGWGNIVHGGLQALLLDEAAGWGTILLVGEYAVTIKASIKYLKPLYVKQLIKITSTLTKREKETLYFSASLHNQNNQLCTTGEFLYKIVPESVLNLIAKHPP